MPGEFSFIEGIRRRISRGTSGLRLGIGDDTAVFEESSGRERLVTTDLLIEGIHFKTEYSPFKTIGHKALAVSLSDIAAMGGRPDYALLSLGIPKGLRSDRGWEEFFDGYFDLAGRYGVALIGGDTSGSKDALVIDSIVIGSCPAGRAITRRGAKPGDAIFVSGRLGASAAGLNLLNRGRRLSECNDLEAEALMAHLLPQPRVELGLRLNEVDSVTSMMDISDGLAGDLRHICEESQVSAVVDPRLIPVAGCLEELYDDPGIRMELALSGGEDYELLFTAPEEQEGFLKNLGAELKLEISRIGQILHISETGHRLGVWKRVEAGFDLIGFKGYDHFLP